MSSNISRRLSTLLGKKGGKNEATTTPAANAAPASQPASAPAVPAKETAAPPAAPTEAEMERSKELSSLDATKSYPPPKDSLRRAYPPIEAYDTAHLAVSELHSIYYEQTGNPKGHPVVYLHGGPGGGITKDDRRWFDPEHYRIVTFDQRGAGKSTPPAELKDNTTWDLVADIEKLREHLGIDKWHVFGGSWGSTLSLAYAQTHPTRVTALILRGIFTLRRSELLFFYQNGASHLFPDQWEPYWNHIPEAERGDMIKAYYERVTGEDEKERLEAARRWSTWENSTSKLYLDPAHIAKGDDDAWALAFARIEASYFYHAGWMRDGQLLEKDSIDKIRHIPAVIVQGRYDVVCPATTAWDLHKAWPEAEFHLIPDAGHSAREPGIQDKLIYATDKFRSVK